MMVDKLEVHALGPFFIKLGSRRIREKNWRAKKALKLFKLLVINYKKEVNAEQIVEKLWPAADSSRGIKRVYDTIYQLRKMLDTTAKESYILKTPQGYSLNDNKDYWFDWTELVSVYNKYKEFNLKNDLSEGQIYQVVKELEAALNLYQGDFMESDLYERWVELPRIHYKEVMLNIIMLLAKLFYRLNQQSKALEYLELGIEKEAYREDFYLLAMKILRKKNRYWKVASLYKKCKETLERELGISPSWSLKEEYNKIIIEQGGYQLESETNLSSRGALRCKRDVFKEIYRLEQRKISRQAVPSLLLSIKFDQIFSHQLLEELISKIGSRLRGEDVITRWDDCAIYILLTQTSLENVSKISYRIFASLFLTEVGKNPDLEWKEIIQQDQTQQDNLNL